MSEIRKNIEFIKASAGSGKTFTLTDRIMKYIESGEYTLSDMMLTTFTNAAASDFKRKTREKLLEHNRTKEAQELELATIGTIDSIAVSYLHRFWYKLGLGADFNELDDEAKKEYTQKSLAELVKAEDITFFEDFYKKLDIGSSDNSKTKDGIWREELLDFIDKIQVYNLDEVQIDESRDYSIQMMDKIFPVDLTDKDLRDMTAIFMEYVRFYIDYLEETKPGHDHLTVCKELATTLPEEGIRINDICMLDKVITHRLTTPWKKNPDLEQRAIDAYNNYTCSNVMKDEVVKYIDKIFGLGKEWYKSFNAYKQENNLVDFSDMGRLFITLLKDQEVQEELKEEIKVVMVDEFQDSNSTQIEIYNLLADIADKNIWVGDPKQAIYRFRGTDTATTQKLADDYAANKSEGQKDLTTTWRSTAPLVDFSNMIFSRSFSGQMPLKDIILEYNTEKENLKKDDPAKPFNSSTFIWNVEPDRGERRKILVSKYQKLACRLSDILTERKGGEELGKEIKPSDFMILCRTNEETEKHVKACKEYGLPVSSAVDDIRDTLEIQLICSILKFFVDSRNEKVRAELLALLEDQKTEDILDMRIEKMTCLAEMKKTGTDLAEENDGTTSCSWDSELRCLASLEDLEKELTGLSVSQTISAIITRMDLLRRVSKWEEGTIRKENLIALIKKAKEYEGQCVTKGKGATIKGFLDHVENCDGIQGSPMSQDGIKIMTYHKVKGLEGRFVILDHLSNNQFTDQKVAKSFLFSTEKVMLQKEGEKNKIHFCPRFLKSENNSFTDSQLSTITSLDEYKAFKNEVRNDDNKLLYVGVTRACEKLILLDEGQPLHWFINIDPKTNGMEYADVAKVAGTNEEYDILQCLSLLGDAKKSDYHAPAGTEGSKEYRIRQLKDSTSQTAKIFKHVSPSKAEEADVDLTLLGEPVLQASSGHRITINANDTEMNVIGTCIHNIFAVWKPDGDRKDEIQKAQDIISGNGLADAITKAEEVIKAAEYIHEFLTKTYGKGKMLTEVPFRLKKSGRIFSGEMDLIWKTDEGCVLLDYKNFPGTADECMDKGNKDHYVGNYKPQLCLYKEALEKAGKKVLATYIFYSVIGAIVKFQ